MANFIIAGLGNPGEKYLNTRHNVGFMCIDKIAHFYNKEVSKTKFKSLYCEINIDSNKILLLKPQTYMNLSGTAISEALSFYKIPLSNLIVIHDDIDLKPMQFRYKIGGSAGGHNGLKSIDQHCGNSYARLRFGVGRTENKDFVSNYVLSNFLKDELIQVDNKSDDIAKNINLIITNKTSELLNILNK